MHQVFILLKFEDKQLSFLLAEFMPEEVLRDFTENDRNFRNSIFYELAPGAWSPMRKGSDR